MTSTIVRRQEFEGEIESNAVNLDLVLAYSYIGALSLFVVLCLAVTNVIRWCKTYQNHQSSAYKSLSCLSTTWVTAIHNWVKIHLLYAPLLSVRRSKPLKPHPRFILGITPPRLAVIILLCILAGNVTILLYRIPWSTELLFTIETLRNRTGTIAVVNLIPVVLLASPISPLLRLFSLSYDSFNLLHRWIARLLAAEVIFHAGVAIASGVDEYGAAGFRANLRTKEWLLCGLLASCAFMVVLVQSWKPFRALSYEIFLYSHIFLVLFASICIWIHLKGKKQQAFLQTAIAMWAFSRITRVANLLYRSIGSRRTMAYLQPLYGDVCRVTLTIPRPWTFRPGQSVYLTIPAIGLITAHPFSVAWMNRRSEELENNDKERSSALNPPAECSQSTTIELIIKRQKGFTNTLFQTATKLPTGEQSGLTAFVEGPYGNPPIMKSYASVLLFAGGIGITHMIPFLHEFASSRKASLPGPRLRLVWVIPAQACFEWVRECFGDVLVGLSSDDSLHIDVYATRDKECGQLPCGIRTRLGRPKIDDILTAELSENPASLLVAVCAGGALSDEVRKASRLSLKRRAPIHFEEEGFGW